MPMSRRVPWAISAIFGILGLVFLLWLGQYHQLTPAAYLVFRSMLALSVAFIAAGLTGTIAVKLPNGWTAGGGMAVFLLVFLFNPAALVQPVDPSKSKYPPAKPDGNSTGDIVQSVTSPGLVAPAPNRLKIRPTEPARKINKVTRPVTAPPDQVQAHGQPIESGSSLISVEERGGKIFAITAIQTAKEESRPATVSITFINRSAKQWVDIVVQTQEGAPLTSSGHIRPKQASTTMIPLIALANHRIKVTRWAPGLFGLAGDGGGDASFTINATGDVNLTVAATN